MKPNLFFFAYLGLLLSVTTELFSQNCVNCYNTSTGTWSSALGNSTSAPGTGSFASGFESSATGNYSSALGSFCISGGMRSIALGGNATTEADNSIAIGYMVRSKQSNAFTLGTGFSLSGYLENNVQNSLVVGFGSNKPTLFVGPAPANEKTGKIGIGNITSPSAKVHIRSDVGEQAVLLIEPWSWSGDNWSELRFGSEQYSIRGQASAGLIFKSPANFVFSNGNVGINVNNPVEKLEVNGKTKTFGLQVTAGCLSGRLLQSDHVGNAVWVDPAWIIKNSNIYRSTGNVGIGVNNPQQRLEVNGIVKSTGIQITSNPGSGRLLQSDSQGFATWTNPAWTISNNNIFRLSGNIGIGTTSPQYKLDISGEIRISDQILGNSTGSSDKLTVKGSENQFSAIIELGKGLNTSQRSLRVVTREGGNIEFLTNTYSRMKITDTEVVIGTPPINGLEHYVDLKVNGHVLSREVEVTPGEWWDEVLQPGYELQRLADLEEFINSNGHLPGIPDQKQVLNEGIRLGEFNGLLLKKIEELTLYIIQLDKENRETKALLTTMMNKENK